MTRPKANDSIEVLTIGDEILSGTIVDTNSSLIAQKLGAMGLEVRRMGSVGDSEEDIVDELLSASRRARAVIVTGGLGPTQDDRTAQAAARAFGRNLVLHEESLRRIRELFQSLGLEMTPNNERQAWVPEGSTVIPNPMGTAPGFCLEANDCILIFLPGVPRELEKMLDESVVPMLSKRLAPKLCISSRTLRLFGIAEAKIDHLVKGALEGLEGVSLASLPQYPENRLRITVRAKGEKEASSLLAEAERLLRERVGRWVYGTDDEDMESLVLALMRKRGLKLTLAESCTGGLIAHRLTNVPGASEVLERCYVVYSEEAKVELGVDRSLIDRHGVVSAQVAEAMAARAASRVPGSVGLSTTGVAGPTGGSEEIPVGTVFIGLSSQEGTWSQRFRFRGGRGNVKTLASTVALDWLRRYLLGEDPQEYTVPWR
jgi:nicotinamide-nucleotide amidase